jgi:hypothetical protein
LDVFVQLVIAAIRTLPWPTFAVPFPLRETSALAAVSSSA